MTDYDGGYVMCGRTGSGEMFSMRDPWGIRPAFWYKNDEHYCSCEANVLYFRQHLNLNVMT